MYCLIKGDKTKHSSPKFLFKHDLQKDNVINAQQIRSSKNLTDLFTKELPTTIFQCPLICKSLFHFALSYTIILFI